jgi:hypothetical protein
MFQRLGIAFLWFASFLCLHELAWSVLGSPRVLGLVIGGMAAASYFFDPAHVFAAASSPHPDTTVDRRLTPAEGIPVSQ